MNVLELAKKYYPRLWGRERIEALVIAGKLTEAEAAEVLQIAYVSAETQKSGQ